VKFENEISRLVEVTKKQVLKVLAEEQGPRKRKRKTDQSAT
jgi:hypothetical protein